MNIDAATDLNQLLVFVQVVQSGSFTGAAKALGMPKSSVSNKISQLEERLGVRLLQRTTRSIGLTQAGNAYYDRAARILDELEDAERSITDLQAQPRGLLRITAPVTFSYAYLGAIVAGYRARYPEVKLEVSVSDRLVDLIEEGFDLGIRAGKLKPSSLIARRLQVVESHVYASPAYLDRAGRPETPADLDHHDCLIFSAPSDAEVWRLRRGDEEQAVRVAGSLSANSLYTVRDAALAGMGVALLPLFVGAGSAQLGGLERVLPAWSSEGGALHAVYPSGRYLSPKVRSFIDYLAEWMEHPPWASGASLA